MRSSLPNHVVRVAATATLAAVLIGGCSSGGDETTTTAPTTGSPGASTSADTTSTGGSAAPASTTPAGPPPVTAPAVGVTTLPPVPMAQEAPFGDGLVATVSTIDEVQLKAAGPGEVAGPGVAVHLSLRNGTAGRIDLGGIVVTASYGAGTPADQSTAAPSSIPVGVLEPGATTEGVWVFSAAAGAAATLEVTIGSISSANVVVIVRS